MSALATPADLIGIKRDGGAWSREQIAEIITGIATGSWADAQVGALLMAVLLRGCSVDETAALTLAMRDSGRVLDTGPRPALRVDKHSTGGVGDKASLLLAPWVAAAGVEVPMISGRGLGHTGGTLDKLEAIPGFRVGLSAEEILATVADCGYAMAAASGDIAPADRRMYALRDVSGTVASVPLITSSILSKKLAEGITGLVLDVKFGRAAFLPERAAAEELMDSLLEVGAAAGLSVTALLTDMDRPLGRAIGNALEVREILDCLHGRGPADLMELTEALAGEMLLLAGVAGDDAAARETLRGRLDSGAVAERFRRNLELQGGPADLLDSPERSLAAAPVVEEVRATESDGGFVADVDPLALGRAAMRLGAGRRVATDTIDPRVGIVCRVARGERIEAGGVVAEIHAADRASAERERAAVAAAFRIAAAAPEPRPLVVARRRASPG